VPPGGTLGELTAASWERSRARERPAVPADVAAVPAFSGALRRSHIAVIAEIKRSSPSKGAINPSLRADAQALAYKTGGAAAISVLTEPARFGGAIADMTAARGAGLPVLRKDFIVTETQLTDTREWGASAALIIVRAIEPRRLRSLHDHALGLGLEILFEIRDENELQRALDAGALIVGVNNRNLETLEIDPGTVERLVPLIPPGCIAVAESGYSSREMVERAAGAGADAVLIGSSLSSASDPAAAVRSLADVAKVSRG
jgi:indole-3-glycerol phosphate synthase